jgi:hypothetical protein
VVSESEGNRVRKVDDSSLTEEGRRQVRREAQRALEQAGALGRFPTPVSDVMAAAQVHEVSDDILSLSFLRRMRTKAGNALKRALSKVIGVFDAAARLVIIDRSLALPKQKFLRLHETAHGALPWQRDLYVIVEECEQSIDPEVAELFDREANTFASEVLFQLDGFMNEAADEAFGILVPVRLSKKYGSSIYSAIRRYVSSNPRACAVLVLDPPVPCVGDGFRCNLRRVITSERFAEMFGSDGWPEYFTPDDDVGAMVPVGSRRLSGRRAFLVADRNGERRECVAEAFTQGHQVFVLLHASESLRPTLVVAH